MLLYAMINANCIHADELERLAKERAQPLYNQNASINSTLNGQNAQQQSGTWDFAAISVLQSLGYA